MIKINRPVLPAFMLLLAIPALTAAQAVLPGGYKTSALTDKTLKAAAAFGRGAYGDFPSVLPVPPEPPGAHKPPPDPQFIEQASVYTGYVATLYYMMRAKIEDSGILPGTQAVPSFGDVSKKVIAAVKNSGFTPRGPGHGSLLADAGFLAEMENLSGARFLDGNTSDFLIDGESSFAVKDSLIKNAKKSIYIASYSFHDDVTGFEAADMLIEAKKRGVEVKVILDSKVIYTAGARVVKRMRDAGVEVLRHMDPKRKGDYWHMKMLLVDDKYAIVGGMNYSDHYSHKNPDGPMWRDTDVLYTGPAAAETRRIFSGIWNSAVEKGGLPLTAIAQGPGAGAPAGSARVAVIFQDPPVSSPPILLNIVKAIYGATRQINIENPYYVAVPAITQAILEARARGVEVNILTNSKKSIDAEAKPMADIIIKGLLPLVPAGVNVYLKKGQTLHSKFMTVDGVYCNIGSYNFHPRSERYDTELNVAIMDSASVARLNAAFLKDLAEAEAIRTVADLGYEPGWLSKIVGKYFYAELSPAKPLVRLGEEL
ncbi:MAG: phosphatidylserine/phosphatidylglycerophosphate/cardiolipin synthase family protein [Elusimicrobiota bacterium]|nr:phosphatidylserine/phosphatidylglycerophosphate/cardiolipin synthase family protein [Elusimicrobiota bacterium]